MHMEPLDKSVLDENAILRKMARITCMELIGILLKKEIRKLSEGKLL